MKVWFNKLSESRREMVDVQADEVKIGRAPDNDVVLRSPLVSQQHAVVRVVDEQFELENVGLNSCLVGDTEVLGGERAAFAPGVKVRVWPYTISFETKQKATISREELESHLRSTVADLELRIHKTLLEQLDLYELEHTGGSNADSVLLLENNIEDVCRELTLFNKENDNLLEEVAGLASATIR